LVGFATIKIAEMRLVIHDVVIHQKGNARWCQLPSKPQISKEGNVLKDNAGKIKYAVIFEFEDRKVSDAFSHAVCAAVLERVPGLFDQDREAGS
jgi:hypothetical protein